jgi:hypothetical protein
MAPIFPLTPKTTWGKLVTANTAKDGTGTMVTLYSAGIYGSRVDQIKARSLGTNVATVLRLFINNGLDPATAANNSLIHEMTLPATTLSEVAALADIDITIPKGSDVACPIPPLPANYKILATIGTTVAAGWQVTVSGGDY